jgi:hypothetical protein
MRFYDSSDTFRGKLGEDIAYLWAAVANGTFIEVSRRSRLVAILNSYDPSHKDRIWRYVRVM